MLRYWPYLLILTVIVTGTIFGVVFRRFYTMPRNLSEVGFALLGIFVVITSFFLSAQICLDTLAIKTTFLNNKISIFAGLGFVFFAAPMLTYSFYSTQKIVAALEILAQDIGSEVHFESAPGLLPLIARELPFYLKDQNGVIYSYWNSGRYSEPSAFVYVEGWADIESVFRPNTFVWASSRDFSIAGQTVSLKGIFSNPTALSSSWKTTLENLIGQSPDFFSHYILIGTKDFLIVRAPKMDGASVATWKSIQAAATEVQKASSVR